MFGLGDKNKKLLTAYANNVLADDVLTEDEEKALMQYASSLGVPTLDRYPDILNRLMIGRVNDGRLPVLTNAQLICKTGEIVHLEANAQMLKEVAIRRWTSSGFSVPIGYGVRYRVGGGQLRQVGTQIDVEDTGILSVTNTRVVFAGQRKIQEDLYAKLASIHVFKDAISIGVTNRQNVGMYKLLNTTGEVVAAVINGAMHHEAPGAKTTPAAPPPNGSQP